MIFPTTVFRWQALKGFRPRSLGLLALIRDADGTFEPDFRTAEASYNSLVYQPIIKNYVSNPLTHRVLPFDANNSMIIRRLTEDIDGISGIMPLATEPDSDWEDSKAIYIQALKDWINSGCPDLLGNVASTSDFIPQLKGFKSLPQGVLFPFQDRKTIAYKYHRLHHLLIYGLL